MDMFSWFTELFAESPPEPLVLGAELWCPYGSEHSYLMLERDDIDIDNLPQANVKDCKKSVNIFPFGECAGGKLCEYKLELEKQWENPEPQNEIVNGKEIITTKSVLICKAEGVEIQAATSGQEYGKQLAEQINLRNEMEEKYPGLFDLLLDPYGSLYLRKGMYEYAIAFLEEQMEKEGEIFLPGIFDGNNLENELVRAALGRLLPDCDVSNYDRFINGLEDTGFLTGMNEVEGWDVHKLNKEMIDMLRIDCRATAEKIETDAFARWQEENKVFTSSMAGTMTQLASLMVMYRAMQAEPVERPAENPLGKVAKKVVNRCKELGKNETDIVDEIIKAVEKGDMPLTNNLQKGNYGEMKMDLYFRKHGYERISLDKVTDLNAPMHQGIDGVYYRANGHPPYIIAEAKYGSSRLGSTLDGKQMCDSWVNKRLADAVGEQMADDIVFEMMSNPSNIQKQLVNVSADGNIIIKILDEYANVIN